MGSQPVTGTSDAITGLPRRAGRRLAILTLNIERISHLNEHCGLRRGDQRLGRLLHKRRSGMTLPPKVDLSSGFVARPCDDPRPQALVRSVLATAHALGLQCLAEGIETPRQQGCTAGRFTGCRSAQ